MEDCVFCKIIAGDIPVQFLYEDDTAVAFNDANPQAPIHILVVPKKHVQSIMQLTPEDGAMMAHLFTVVQKLMTQQGVAQRGFRVMINTGKEGGQTVPHLHVHALAGKQFHD